jgi:plastocyanin
MKHITLRPTLRQRLALPAIAGLALALTTAVAAAAATSQVSARDFAFTPASATVAVGDTVIWTNYDPVEHNVHIVNGQAGPLIGEGETYARTFTEPGRYAYFCDPHPSMTGEIVVSAPAGSGGPAPTPGDTTPNTATVPSRTDDTPPSMLLLVGAALGALLGLSVSRRVTGR